MAYANPYKKAHLITKAIALPIAVIIIITICYLFFAETNSIRSIILASVINIFYFFLLHLYLSPIIIKQGNVIKIIAFITIYTAIATTIYLLLLENNILVYPEPFYTHRLPFTFIGSVCAILSLAVFASAFSLHLILNSYLLSIESYSLLMKSYQSEINILNLESNPTYILNSLNKLNSLMREGDIQKSIIYHLELIELMDEQVKYQNTEIVHLRDELNWIEYYFQTEQQRKYYNFEYSITLEENGLSDFQIPSMILQPLVTNILVYKLRPEIFHDYGHIHIRINKIDKHEICVTITDNGINDDSEHGNSLELKSSLTDQDITKRINLINEIMNYKIKRTRHTDKAINTSKIFIKQLEAIL